MKKGTPGPGSYDVTRSLEGGHSFGKEEKFKVKKKFGADNFYKQRSSVPDVPGYLLS